LKNAKKISSRAAIYLENNTKKYSSNEIRNCEINSYNNSMIELPIYRFFEHIETSVNQDIHSQFIIADDIVKRETV